MCVYVCVCLKLDLLVTGLALYCLCLSAPQWVINTPDEGAIKWWIGNAAEDGKAATVFARLKVPASDGEPFLVHLRPCGAVLCCAVPVCGRCSVVGLLQLSKDRKERASEADSPFSSQNV